ncbi:uncharacterized protein ARMOST_07526 [Armillaria ostoyae]|uniref:Uncharacterized protein n=1 Tax=Armillaria ostoyae TaxID=47428 RepID=A0A284R626_ARMOS|nr:uncharacterized protein ARMOST_07526 [Armillaria ostoyae]
MITNNQFIQTTSYLFAIAIAMALSVLALVRDILALLTFSALFPAHEYPHIAVTVKVEITQYSTTSIEPSVSSDSTLITVSSECYSGARVGKRSGLS